MSLPLALCLAMSRFWRWLRLVGVFAKGELASWLFLDDVQGFGMAKTWCFLIEGKLAFAFLLPPHGNRCLPFIRTWEFWQVVED
ncbi:hypothetical protein GBA52_022804 [Prunus armeniaca]|nr:hypothetical protein GBA52_022804 [Prunus armeniaca]